MANVMEVTEKNPTCYLVARYNQGILNIKPNTVIKQRVVLWYRINSSLNLFSGFFSLGLWFLSGTSRCIE